MIKNERIPEHKLNVTNTAGKAVENMTDEHAKNQKGARLKKEQKIIHLHTKVD